MDISGLEPRNEHLVVIGGGQAAAQIIEVARQQGFEGRITLVSEEPILPYQRPPLSKQYLKGTHGPDWLLYRPERFYQKYGIKTLLSCRATAINRAKQIVMLESGSELAYGKLALAMGARPRPLTVPGAEHPHVFSIRTLADADRLRARLAESRRAVIVGGGFIGLESAAVLVTMGVKVTLLEAQDRLIPRLAGGEVAKFLLDQHRLHGVDIVLNAQVKELRGKVGGVVEVLLVDGASYEGEIVLVGIGSIPNVEIATAAGLECNNGIVVDEFARTSDPSIFAAGDCTNHPNPLHGRRLRLETVHNAVEQGRTAGATIAGKDLPYSQSPWVWSDQYQFRLQSVGISEGYDRTILRGNVNTARFSLFYYCGEGLLAVNCINQPLVFGAVRRLLNESIPLKAEDAGNPCFDITRLVPRNTHMDFDVPWSTKTETKNWLCPEDTNDEFLTLLPSERPGSAIRRREQ